LTIYNCILFLSYTRRKNDYTPRVITDRFFFTFMTRLARFRNNDLLLPSNNERQNCNAVAAHFIFFTTPKRNKITTLCSNALYLPKNNNTFVFNNKNIYKKKHYNCSYFILYRAVKCSFFESQTLLLLLYSCRIINTHIYTYLQFSNESNHKKPIRYVFVYIESTFRIFTVSFRLE